MMGGRAWSESELDRLRADYPNGDIGELASVIGRPLHSIKRMACHIGVKRSAEAISKRRKEIVMEVPSLVRFRRTHGRAQNDATYRIWIGMRRRCTDMKSSNYAGRGIKVCARWACFEDFLADMGSRPEGMSLDRIDNDGDYEPSNCRWATTQQQSRNKRTSTHIEAFGERRVMADWCERFGINCATFVNRLKRGIPIEAALSNPVRSELGRRRSS